MLMINFSVVLVPLDMPKPGRTGDFFPRLRHYPLQRDDLKEIYGILDYLDDLGVNEGKKVYVLASSRSFNEDTLRFGCLVESDRYRFCGDIINISHVDKRDGLPLGLFEAEYVVTTDSPQVHLAPQDQRVITVFQDLMVKGEGVGKNYRKLDREFSLEKDIKVFVYQKIENTFNEDDLRKLESDFGRMYPGLKQKFMIPSDLFDRITK